MPEPPAPPLPTGRLTWKKASRVKFVIKWVKKYKPRNSAYVIGGYNDGKNVYVMYRISGGSFSSTQDGIVMLMPEDKVLMNWRFQEHRLPDERWEKFLRSHDGSMSLIGRQQIRKMSVDQLRPHVEFKVFEIYRPEAEIPDS